jgi:hypothetical protein
MRRSSSVSPRRHFGPQPKRARSMAFILCRMVHGSSAGLSSTSRTLNASSNGQSRTQDTPRDRIRTRKTYFHQQHSEMGVMKQAPSACGKPAPLAGPWPRRGCSAPCRDAVDLLAPRSDHRPTPARRSAARSDDAPPTPDQRRRRTHSPVRPVTPAPAQPRSQVRSAIARSTSVSRSRHSRLPTRSLAATPP